MTTFFEVRYEHSISLPFWGFGTNLELSEQVFACAFPDSVAIRISVILQTSNPSAGPAIGQTDPRVPM